MHNTWLLFGHNIVLNVLFTLLWCLLFDDVELCGLQCWVVWFTMLSCVIHTVGLCGSQCWVVWFTLLSCVVHNVELCGSHCWVVWFTLLSCVLFTLLSCSCSQCWVVCCSHCWFGSWAVGCCSLKYFLTSTLVWELFHGVYTSMVNLDAPCCKITEEVRGCIQSELCKVSRSHGCVFVLVVQLWTHEGKQWYSGTVVQCSAVQLLYYLWRFNVFSGQSCSELFRVVWSCWELFRRCSKLFRRCSKLFRRCSKLFRVVQKMFKVVHLCNCCKIMIVVSIVELFNCSIALLFNCSIVLLFNCLHWCLSVEEVTER